MKVLTVASKLIALFVSITSYGNACVDCFQTVSEQLFISFHLLRIRNIVGLLVLEISPLILLSVKLTLTLIRHMT